VCARAHLRLVGGGTLEAGQKLADLRDCGFIGDPDLRRHGGVPLLVLAPLPLPPPLQLR
jgi:hypothetical protein